MDNYTTSQEAMEQPSVPRLIVRRPLFAALLIALGCVTLGGGVGAGHAIARNFVPATAVTAQTENSQSAVTTIHVNPLAIPINPQTPDIADIVPKVKDSVVSISMLSNVTRPFGGAQPGSGSGFIFYQDDEYVFIATNHHVIENAASITVSLDDNENVPAHVIGSYPASDIAVIAVSIADLSAKGVPFAVASLGDSDILRMGDTVLAIGNAMGAGQTVTKGIVSAMGLTIDVNDPNRPGTITLNVMQTDAAVNRGNSGGPLLNHHGEVIGIVTAKQMGNDIEGMGYALPINEAKIILHELKESGAVRLPFIGIGHDTISEFTRQLFNLPYSGFLIRDVVAGSPADYAGIMVDDLLIYYNDTRLYGLAELSRVWQASRPGDEVTLGLIRNGERINVTLILGTAPRP